MNLNVAILGSYCYLGRVMEVELVIGHRSLKVDRKILAKYSDYFFAMFSSPFAESSSDQIPLRNMNFKAMKVVIDYMNTGKLAITEGNIEEVYLTADFLQIDIIKRRCQELFVKHIGSSNCIRMYELGQQHGMPRVVELSRKMMLKCFEQISEDLEYFEFSCGLLVSLLSDSDLNISKEETLINVVRKWVSHKHDERSSFKDDLVQCIRLELLSEKRFERFLRSDFLCYDVDLRRRLIERRKERLEMIQTPKATNRNTKKLPMIGQERFGMIHNRVYLLGGLTDTTTAPGIEVFGKDLFPTALVSGHFTSERQGETLPLCSYGGGAVVIDGIVYFVEGRSGGATSRNRLFKVHIHSHTFELISELPISVDQASITCSDGRIYVVGGFVTLDNSTSHSPCSHVQIYDTATGCWETGPDLVTPRAHAATVGLNSGGGLTSRVLVIGGYGQNKLKSVELIENGVLSEFPPMIKERHSFVAELFEGMVYAVGGWKETTAERYDFRVKQWSLLKSYPNIHRDCVQGAVCDGQFYVFGGVAKNRNVASIERYDAEKDKWSPAGNLIYPRLYPAIAVT
eukprot:sb/3463448/